MGLRASAAAVFASCVAACTAGEAPRGGAPPAGQAPVPPRTVEAQAAIRPAPPAEVAVPPAPAASATQPPDPRSPLLRDGRFHSPMPGGYIGGWFGDTGLDIAGDRLAVYAIAAGTLDYSERGHTLWTTPPDTPSSVRIAFDAPVPWKGHRVTHAYYTHLSHVAFDQAEGAPLRRHVDAGERIGTSGVGNGVAHLHLGLLMDDLVEQDSWAGILREDDIRTLFGGYKNGELLPKPKPGAPRGSDAAAAPRDGGGPAGVTPAAGPAG